MCVAVNVSKVFTTLFLRRLQRPPTRAMNAMTTSDLKRTACEAIDGRQEALTGLSLDLWAHPETHYDERHAHRSLTAFLTDAGFDVQQHYKLKTAFRATFGAGGPRVAVMCEYDALPEMGHACGHNLIAMTGVGAGLGVMAALKAAGSAGTLTILGTPAEEEGSGKIDLLRAGAFDDIDVAIMSHPCWANAVHMTKLAIHTLSIRFVGKASHAAGFQWQGVNALDAAVVCYTSISCLRQQLKPTWRVHGIITNGGVRPNIIPEKTEMLYYIRAPTMRELTEFKDRIRICVEGAATATGCTVTYEFNDKPMAEVVTNEVIARLYQENAESLGVSFLDPLDPRVIAASGSTDMGNVTQTVPGIHAYFQITSICRAHTREFATAAASPEAHESAMDTAKTLAMTAIDIIAQPELMTSIREAFVQDMAAVAESGS